MNEGHVQMSTSGSYRQRKNNHCLFFPDASWLWALFLSILAGYSSSSPLDLTSPSNSFFLLLLLLHSTFNIHSLLFVKATFFVSLHHQPNSFILTLPSRSPSLFNLTYSRLQPVQQPQPTRQCPVSSRPYPPFLQHTHPSCLLSSLPSFSTLGHILSIAPLGQLVLSFYLHTNPSTEQPSFFYFTYPYNLDCSTLTIRLQPWTQKPFFSSLSSPSTLIHSTQQRPNISIRHSNQQRVSYLLFTPPPPPSPCYSLRLCPFSSVNLSVLILLDELSACCTGIVILLCLCLLYIIPSSFSVSPPPLPMQKVFFFSLIPVVNLMLSIWYESI